MIKLNIHPLIHTRKGENMVRHGYDETNGTVIGENSPYMVFYTKTGYRIVIPVGIKELDASQWIEANHPESFRVGGELRVY